MQNEESRYPQSVGLWELVRYFLRLGSFGFGGPIALAGYMQRDLVPRGRITSEEYKQGLAFAQMMPGPLAAQLAMWIGFIRHGVIGASLVGIVFILPPYLIVAGDHRRRRNCWSVVVRKVTPFQGTISAFVSEWIFMLDS